MIRSIQSALAAALVAAACSLGPTAALAQATATPHVAPEYRLGAGDVLQINVYQNPDLALQTRVTEAGLITYPLLGTIKVGGMSVTAAEKMIAEGLRAGNFVKSPQVSILVMQVRGNQASVLGMVNRPGRYPLEVADMHLTDLLALAGGAAVNGADTATVVGTRDGKPFRDEVDVPTIFAPGGKDKDIPIQNGDAIYVGRQPLVYIYGEVQRPGPMRVERGMTVMQVLAGGGGLTLRGTQKGIQIHRKAADGKIEVIEPSLDDKVQDGDVVFVKESLF
jgi:polysaccharide export outer membrane protein